MARAVALPFSFLALLAGCAPAPFAPPPPDVDGPPPGFPFELDRNGQSHFQVVESLLIIQVFKAGRLGQLGHNHVVSSRATVGITDGIRAELYLPVRSLSVDRPDLRAAGDPAFASQPAPSDIEATRRNMLGPALLDATRYPWMTAIVTPIGDIRFDARVSERKAAPRSPKTAKLSLTIKAATTVMDVPIDIRWTPEEARVSTSFTVSHQALGLTPFSALGGALRVADDLKVSFTATVRPDVRPLVADVRPLVADVRPLVADVRPLVARVRPSAPQPDDG